MFSEEFTRDMIILEDEFRVCFDKSHLLEREERGAEGGGRVGGNIGKGEALRDVQMR